MRKTLSSHSDIEHICGTARRREPTAQRNPPLSATRTPAQQCPGLNGAGAAG